MHTEGEFRYTNGTAINTELDKDRICSVINHEYVHNQLYASTTYGQIVLMLEKNELFHAKSKIFKEILFDYMNRMQERIAVNVEILQECIGKGMIAYDRAIENLKSRNRNYYNYFRKLCCANGKVNDSKDAEQLIKILNGLATLALNVNPELIPFVEINNAKELKAYFNNPNNSALISPNRRFDILINVLFRNNDNNNDIESVVDGSIDFEKMYDYEYIHNIAYERVLTVISDSPIFERLAKRIETVGKIQLEFEGGEYLTARPTKLSDNNIVNYSMIDNEREFYEIIKELEMTEIFVQHSLGGFEEFRLINLYGYKDGKKTIWGLHFLDENQFFKVISNVPCNIVFNKTKLIEKEGKSIRKMAKMLPIYIYMDTPIFGVINFIENFFYKGKFGFIDLETYSIFVAYKRNFVFFADIVDGAKGVIKNLFINNNIEYVEDLSTICNISEICRIDEKCIEFEISRVEDMKLEK